MVVIWFCSRRGAWAISAPHDCRSDWGRARRAPAAVCYSLGRSREADVRPPSCTPGVRLRLLAEPLPGAVALLLPQAAADLHKGVLEAGPALPDPEVVVDPTPGKPEGNRTPAIVEAIRGAVEGLPVLEVGHDVGQGTAGSGWCSSWLGGATNRRRYSSVCKRLSGSQRRLRAMK